MVDLAPWGTGRLLLALLLFVGSAAAGRGAEPIVVDLSEHKPASGVAVLSDGARLRLTAGGRTQLLEICGGNGFFCSNEQRQFVGLGPCERLDVLEIQWPSGRRDRWDDLPTGVCLTIVEGSPPRIQSCAGSRLFPSTK